MPQARPPQTRVCILAGVRERRTILICVASWQALRRRVKHIRGYMTRRDVIGLLPYNALPAANGLPHQSCRRRQGWPPVILEIR
jgi:hypothetical protein